MHRPITQRIIVGLIALCYLVIGTLYAVMTPPWQVPDEPAHYNYIRQLAAGDLPIIEPGDYDQGQQSSLVSAGFPDEVSLDWMQYEDHQPPLYYLLATPLWLLFDGALLPLRLFSVLLGLGVVLLAAAIARHLFPQRPVITIVATSLVAFVPQHVAMLAGVNNDSLAELLLAACLFGVTVILTSERPTRPWLYGLLLAAVFVTKLQAYIAAPILVLAVLIRWQRDREPVSWLLHWLVAMLLPPLLIGSLWWTRNLLTYGGLDWMGLAAHDVVVIGQPTTADWIASNGLGATVKRFFQLTFRSFWGMFGWLAVAMDARLYQALGVFSGMTLLGAGLAFKGTRLSSWRKWFADHPVGVLFFLSACFTLMGYLWWNLSYVQHQGRYLFTALIPIGLASGISWEKLAKPPASRLVGRVLLLLIVLLVGWGAIRADLPIWSIVFCLGMMAALWINGSLSLRWRWLLPACVCVGLAGTSVASLFLFVIPWLN